jgi:hypothetical protein
MTMQPTLLNSCAAAATAKEARFRINAKPQPARQSRVIALDPGATAVIRPMIGLPWHSTRFLTLDSASVPDSGPRPDVADIMVTAVDNTRVRLSEELDGADFLMMVATANDGAGAASAIGVACSLRGIMTAAVVLGVGHTVDAAVSALRPYARVLLVSRDPQDVAEVMSAVAS